jgi:hypothetical protein
MVSLARSETRVVYDLYDPVLNELVASVSERRHVGQDNVQLERHRLTLETALLAGNAFICASERQRDLWLGALAALGRLGHDEHFRPHVRHLIDVVPFGSKPIRQVCEPSRRAPRGRRALEILVWGRNLELARPLM